MKFYSRYDPPASVQEIAYTLGLSIFLIRRFAEPLILLTGKLTFIGGKVNLQDCSRLLRDCALQLPFKLLSCSIEKLRLERAGCKNPIRRLHLSKLAYAVSCSGISYAASVSLSAEQRKETGSKTCFN